MTEPCQACASSDGATQVLSNRGVRLTDLRRDVLRLLHHNKQPVSAYELFDQLNSEGKASAPPAVYRVLDFLIDQGLAHKLNSLSAYTACCASPHPHQATFLICHGCGDVEEFDNPPAKAVTKNATAIGFAVENVTIEATGLCGACQ